MMALFEGSEGGVFTALLHYPPPMEIITRRNRRFVLCTSTEGAEPLLYCEIVCPAFQKRLDTLLGNRSTASPEQST
jgi:hypothetical protein